MKQISLRMEDELHKILTEEAKANRMSLTHHILNLVNKRGDLYTTNLHHKIQLRINLTHLGDLLVLGRIQSFEAICSIMEESLKNGEQVILERHYDNFVPVTVAEFNSIEELEKWKNSILQFHK